LLRVVVVLGSFGRQARDVEGAVIAPNYLQSIGVWEWKRPQQDSVDDAEDRGAGADPEGKRDHNHGRKSRLP
jgi:hypothetical protein